MSSPVRTCPKCGAPAVLTHPYSERDWTYTPNFTPPIYIYRSPVERQLFLPELPEPLIIGPNASVEIRWRKQDN